jgi:pimeloyl-ACP methyl ester carboxylesterase
MAEAHGPPRRPDGPSCLYGPSGPLRFPRLDHDIRFLAFEGRRLAYSTYGEGPPMVFGPRWVSHLEEEWDDPRQRAFYSEIARTHRVVRFDRIGCGLSSRELDPRPTIEPESRQLEAVIEAAGEPAVVFATSCCCLAASQLAVRRPELVPKLVYFGGYASRNDIPDATRNSPSTPAFSARLRVPRLPRSSSSSTSPPTCAESRRMCTDRRSSSTAAATARCRSAAAASSRHCSRTRASCRSPATRICRTTTTSAK